MKRVPLILLKCIAILFAVIATSFLLLFLTSIPKFGYTESYERSSEVYLTEKIVLHDDELTKIYITSYNSYSRDLNDDENIRETNHYSDIKVMVTNKTQVDLKILLYPGNVSIDDRPLNSNESLSLYLAKDYENKFKAGSTQEAIISFSNNNGELLIRDFNKIILPIYIFNGEDEVQEFYLPIDISLLKQKVISNFIIEDAEEQGENHSESQDQSLGEVNHPL